MGAIVPVLGLYQVHDVLPLRDVHDDSDICGIDLLEPHRPPHRRNARNVVLALDDKWDRLGVHHCRWVQSAFDEDRIPSFSFMSQDLFRDFDDLLVDEEVGIIIAASISVLRPPEVQLVHDIESSTLLQGIVI